MTSHPDYGFYGLLLNLRLEKLPSECLLDYPFMIILSSTYCYITAADDVELKINK
jgi:hypothetical protein